MINSFLSLNLAFIVVVFISTLFLFVGIFYSRKKVSLNTYLVSNRNVGVFNLSATLIASSLGAWILFGPPTAATWGGFGSVIGYALGTAFPMIALIFFGKKLRVLLPKLGCEGLADMLYKYVNGVYIPEMWGPGEHDRLWCYRVEVRETQSNMAFREGHREWNEDLFEGL